MPHSVARLLASSLAMAAVLPAHAAPREFTVVAADARPLADAAIAVEVRGAKVAPAAAPVEMAAWVAVDTPLFGKTDASGKATLDVRDGGHRVKLRHASLREAMREPPWRAGSGASTLRLAATARP